MRNVFCNSEIYSNTPKIIVILKSTFHFQLKLKTLLKNLHALEAFSNLRLADPTVNFSFRIFLFQQICLAIGLLCGQIGYHPCQHALFQEIV